MASRERVRLTQISVSITDACNRQCSFCPHADPAIFPNKSVFMAPETMVALADDLRDMGFPGTIVISGYGEPAINPDLLDIIAACRGFHVSMTTNGDYIFGKHRRWSLDQLAGAGLRLCSVDMYDDDAYECAAEQMGWKKAPVEKEGTPSTHYAHSADPFRRLALEFIPRYRDGILRPVNRGGLMPDFRPVDRNRRCGRPMSEAMVDWDGTVRLCCHDWGKVTDFGNVRRESFSEIYFRSVVPVGRQLLTGRHGLNPCERCDV